MPPKVWPIACPLLSSDRQSCLGERDPWGVSLFRSISRFGVHLVPGLRPQRFSVIHADDLVHMLILAAERGRRLPPSDQDVASAGQGYYFAACEQDPTYADLGRLVAESVGHRVLVIPTIMPVVRTVAVVSEAVSRLSRLPMPLNIDKVREIAAGSWVCSAQTAKKDLGFEVGRPADRAAAANGPMVSARRMAVRE